MGHAAKPLAELPRKTGSVFHPHSLNSKSNENVSGAISVLGMFLMNEFPLGLNIHRCSGSTIVALKWQEPVVLKQYLLRLKKVKIYKIFS